ACDSHGGNEAPPRLPVASFGSWGQPLGGSSVPLAPTGPAAREAGVQASGIGSASLFGESIVSQHVSAPAWPQVGRIFFRFSFAYLLLYNVFGGNFQALWGWLWDPVVSAAGKHLFGVPIAAPQVTGSGDRAYDYVQVFCFFVLAVVAAAGWTLLDRKRR